MPFTNTATIRNHLQETATLRDSYSDVAVELQGGSPVALMHSRLKDGSLVVKGKELGAPCATTVILDSAPVALGRQNLIPDSVVVASDSSLGRIFNEHTDYHIDYAAGTIMRLPSGSIPAAASVVVWFFAYRIFQRDTDFHVDHARGTIRRISGGQIEDGQSVFVDYQTQSLLLDESQIEDAITEADDLLLGLIDNSYRDSSDQSLVTAETYLTLAVLCRIKAGAALELSPGSNIARNWQELGERYEADGLKIAARFAAVHGRLNSPVQVTGGETR